MDRFSMRRQWLRAGLAGAALPLMTSRAVAAPRAGLATAAGLRPDLPARLGLINLHTSEALNVVFRHGERYLTDALARIDHVLRDHRTGLVHPIDPALLDQLDRLAGALGAGSRPFHVISGYRAPASNAMLAARSGGVASRSLHLSGRAIDIRLPGVPLATVHEAALRIGAGGVGYYPGSDFVHLDTGRARRWRG